MLTEFVEVHVNNTDIPICWEQSTRDDVANTLCKQLGLNGAKSTNSVRYMHAYITTCSYIALPHEHAVM